MGMFRDLDARKRFYTYVENQGGVESIREKAEEARKEKEREDLENGRKPKHNFRKTKARK